MRAVIVGGGIGGLATAALRRVGIESVVLERADALDPVGFGLVLAENALRALDVVGLADGVSARGAFGERLVVRTQDG